MRANDVTADRLRELAARRPQRGKVLSLYLDLSSSEFATGSARSSAITSLLNDARRHVEDADLDHDDRTQLRADLERVEQVLDAEDLPAGGAAGLAVFASGSADLLEVLRLPRPVPSHAVLDDAPHLGPLAEVTAEADWAVVLVSRGTARFFFGAPDAMAEQRVGDFDSDRFERTVESEIGAHLREVAAAVDRLYHAGRFKHLVVAAPHALIDSFTELLGGEARERVRGSFDADVEDVPADAVRASVLEIAERHRAAERDALLQRFAAGVGSSEGRAAAGLQATLEALTERRVEALLLGGGYTAAGVRCPRCGWLGPQNAGSCPADGTPTEHRDDVVEDAARAAVEQDAAVVRVAEPERTPLGRHGIGAVLRF